MSIRNVWVNVQGLNVVSKVHLRRRVGALMRNIIRNPGSMPVILN